MELQGCVALVTGANRGLGKALLDALFAAGAGRVYAGARDPQASGIRGRYRCGWTSPARKTCGPRRATVPT
jgi:NAD(P)-dependent dehydrogenase (short-subunit alcohol dehydrogenase family)